MGHRLSKIVTRTGDAGTTGLGDGSRVAKDAARVEAIGAVDELNSTIGLLLTEQLPAEMAACLVDVQHDLFDLGGELSIPGYEAVTAAHVARLEERVEHFNGPSRTAQGVRAAGRNPRLRARARRPHRVPTSRAGARPPRTRRIGDRGGPSLREPAVGPALRDRPRAHVAAGRRDVLWEKGRVRGGGPAARDADAGGQKKKKPKAPATRALAPGEGGAIARSRRERRARQPREMVDRRVRRTGLANADDLDPARQDVDLDRSALAGSGDPLDRIARGRRHPVCDVDDGARRRETERDRRRSRTPMQSRRS